MLSQVQNNIQGTQFTPVGKEDTSVRANWIALPLQQALVFLLVERRPLENQESGSPVFLGTLAFRRSAGFQRQSSFFLSMQNVCRMSCSLPWVNAPSPAPLSCPWHYDQRTHGAPPWGVLATHCGQVDLFPSTVLPCPKNLIPNALVIKHIQVPPWGQKALEKAKAGIIWLMQLSLRMCSSEAFRSSLRASFPRSRVSGFLAHCRAGKRETSWEPSG